jgi:hypothetical protein
VKIHGQSGAGVCLGACRPAAQVYRGGAVRDARVGHP